jgi:uncharacterized protein YdaU (DUF1376 family)
MSRPWMPLYIADYLADTAHLNAAQSGAYLHLIMHYWTSGKLPDDDRALARIARMTATEWKRDRAIIQAFFRDGWKHKRIEAERQRVDEVSETYASRARHAANKRWSKDANGNASSIPQALLQHAEPQPHSSVPKGTGATAPPDPKKELFDRGRQVLGRESGGLISKLLRACGPEDDPKSIAKARARIEDASTKANPAEWLGRVLAPRAGSPVLTESGQPWPEGIV